MTYPGQIDRFADKLNKKASGLHEIEERLELSGGSFDGVLAHDNIVNGSVRVYTGAQFSGLPVENVVLSIPADTPWKRKIRIFSAAAAVYVTYETPGDTVEASDINELQNGLTATQTEIERYKEDGLIDGGAFQQY